MAIDFRKWRVVARLTLIHGAWVRALFRFNKWYISLNRTSIDLFVKGDLIIYDYFIPIPFIILMDECHSHAESPVSLISIAHLNHPYQCVSISITLPNIALAQITRNLRSVRPHV